jgi:hypothetical protein
MFSNAIREDEMTRAAAPIRKNCQPLAVLLEKAADTILENGSVFVHYAQKLNELADRYSEGRFHLAVLGQFKRGKSTLLNALTGVPGSEPLALTQLLLDFNGTLSVDGVLLPGVSERLEVLGRKLRITVLTADTFGARPNSLKGCPCSCIS